MKHRIPALRILERPNKTKTEVEGNVEKELKIETIKRQSLAENESLSLFIKMHPRK